MRPRLSSKFISLARISLLIRCKHTKNLVKTKFYSE
ncbi:hypothetical protein [Porphyromonas phage phage010a_HG1691old]